MKKTLLILLPALVLALIGFGVKQAFGSTAPKDGADRDAVYFADIEALQRAVSTVRSETGGRYLSIDSPIAEGQDYDTRTDAADLYGLSGIRAPGSALSGTTLSFVAVTKDAVTYHYDRTDRPVGATFTWYRGGSPEGSPECGARRRTADFGGVLYSVTEWTNSRTGAPAGVAVEWERDGMCYRVSAPAGYSDAALLDFCTVRVLPQA